jgi:hypothetical protein
LKDWQKARPTTLNAIGFLLDDYCFCRCCQLLNSKKGCFFALSMAHVFQTILSVDVKEKAIAALISTLKMVHSAPLLIIDATGTSNRLPSQKNGQLQLPKKPLQQKRANVNMEEQIFRKKQATSRDVVL